MIIAQRPQQLPTMNATLHAISQVFCDPAKTHRRCTISESKLDKGDAAFSTKKRLLGWDVDTHTMTLTLPPHRLAHLTEMLHSFMQKKRSSIKGWRRLLGTLRSTVPALYGANHLFSILQHAFTSRHARIRITSLLRHTLRDWITLAHVATHQPVPLHSLVPTAPLSIAATDASKHGMGGFFITPTHQCVWQQAFPTNVIKDLVSTDNPTGTVTT
jgi:hypothetical protein